jgi:hypothetical protein
MSDSKIKLPSNCKFGVFFSCVFMGISLFFGATGVLHLAQVFGGLSAILVIIAITNDNLLLPLNKLWMYLGSVLGSVVSPIVLGLLFFGIFTPTAILTRFFGRDELSVKKSRALSFWKYRNESVSSDDSLTNQF